MTLDVNLTVIRLATPADQSEWLRMRHDLWPDVEPQDLLLPTAPAHPGSILGTGTLTFSYVVGAGQNTPDLAVSNRDSNDVSVLLGNGCETSPVGYIEGWLVDEDLRGQGLGKALVKKAENWAREQGLHEMASDTWLENEASIAAHLKMGYEEVERLIHFAKTL